MFNMLKMDLRRLFRSRSFYIILGVTAVLIVLLAALMSAASDPEKLAALENTGMVVTDGSSDELREELQSMTQLDFVHEFLGKGFLLIIACIGVSLSVHSDFSNGYIKNICFARPRRWEYVLSKILLAGGYSGMITAIGVLLSLACASLFGIHPMASPIGHMLQYTFWMWLPTWAFSLMGLALVLLTRGSTLGVIMAVIAGGGLTAALLQNLCQRFGWPDLARYLLSMVVSTQCIPVPGAGQMPVLLGCCLGWAVFYAAGSLLLMEKRDI